MKPKTNWVLDDNNPILREKAIPLTLPVNKQDQKLINRMVKYVDASYENQATALNIRSGIALAGPQVGLNKQVIYVHFSENGIEHKYLIANPKVVATSADFAYLSRGEGCLSVSQDIKGIVKRRNKIIVNAYDLLTKQNIGIDAIGLLAICLQHEIDHLSGVLYYDRIDRLNPEHTLQEWIKY
ncbi:MAG: peptide deformylase [Mycoplasmataceae bacterium]|jgi:peptide deformylase|nr:peptide deformylase [Mycoplasmataceae bacterium]